MRNESRGSDVDFSEYIDAIDDLGSLELSQDEFDVIVYVAGCAQRIVINCDAATCNIKGLPLEPRTPMIEDLDRGGLTRPAARLVNILEEETKLLMSIVARKQYLFTTEGQQRQADIMAALTGSVHYNPEIDCDCLKTVIRFFSNVLLKNLAKSVTEQYELKEQNKKIERRKAKKLSSATF